MSSLPLQNAWLCQTQHTNKGISLPQYKTHSKNVGVPGSWYEEPVAPHGVPGGAAQNLHENGNEHSYTGNAFRSFSESGVGGGHIVLPDDGYDPDLDFRFRGSHNSRTDSVEKQLYLYFPSHAGDSVSKRLQSVYPTLDGAADVGPQRNRGINFWRERLSRGHGENLPYPDTVHDSIPESSFRYSHVKDWFPVFSKRPVNSPLNAGQPGRINPRTGYTDAMDYSVKGLGSAYGRHSMHKPPSTLRVSAGDRFDNVLSNEYDNPYRSSQYQDIPAHRGILRKRYGVKERRPSLSLNRFSIPNDRSSDEYKLGPHQDVSRSYNLTSPVYDFDKHGGRRLLKRFQGQNSNMVFGFDFNPYPNAHFQHQSERKMFPHEMRREPSLQQANLAADVKMVESFRGRGPFLPGFALQHETESETGVSAPGTNRKYSFSYR